MRLLDYEQKIRDLVSTNREDPEIYRNLQELAYYFLLRKKACKCQKDVEDISYTIAADMYMKILDGETFSYVLSYLERVYKGYLTKYYREFSETISFDPSIEAKETLYGKSSTYEFNYLSNKIYLEEIGRVIDKVMQGSCKYKEGTPAYLNLKTSLALSLLRGRLCSFHLDSEQEYYLKLVLSNFYNKVKEDGLGISDNEDRSSHGGSYHE